MVLWQNSIRGHGMPINLAKNRNGTNMPICILFLALLYKIITIYISYRNLFLSINGSTFGKIPL